MFNVTIKIQFVTTLKINIKSTDYSGIFIHSFLRSQNAEDRWSFSTIVDELLEIVNEVPNSKNMEVMRCVFYNSVSPSTRSDRLVINILKILIN